MDLPSPAHLVLAAPVLRAVLFSPAEVRPTWLLVLQAPRQRLVSLVEVLQVLQNPSQVLNLLAPHLFLDLPNLAHPRLLALLLLAELAHLPLEPARRSPAPIRPAARQPQAFQAANPALHLLVLIYRPPSALSFLEIPTSAQEPLNQLDPRQPDRLDLFRQARSAALRALSLRHRFRPARLLVFHLAPRRSKVRRLVVLQQAALLQPEAHPQAFQQIILLPLQDRVPVLLPAALPTAFLPVVLLLALPRLVACLPASRLIFPPPRLASAAPLRLAQDQLPPVPFCLVLTPT